MRRTLREYLLRRRVLLGIVAPLDLDLWLLLNREEGRREIQKS